MRVQKIFESLGLVDAGDDPERVTKHRAKLLGGEREIGGVVFFRYEIEEVTDGVLVDEIFTVDAKKLGEVESGVVDVDKIFVEHRADIVGEDIQARQVGVGVMLEGIVAVENFFGALLIGVSPIEAPRGVKVVGEVKGRAAEHQDVGAVLDEIFDDVLPESGADALVSLVDDDQLPIDGKNIGVLVEFAADGRRAAQILNGGEVNEGGAGVNELVEGGADNF